MLLVGVELFDDIRVFLWWFVVYLSDYELIVYIFWIVYCWFMEVWDLMF